MEEKQPELRPIIRVRTPPNIYRKYKQKRQLPKKHLLEYNMKILNK